MTKTIFITGGSTGIGQASVEKFHAMGWNVGFTQVMIAEKTGTSIRCVNEIEQE